MTNSEIRHRAFELIKSNVAIFMAVSLIYSILGNLFRNINILNGIVTTVISISSTCFYMRAFNRGVPDINDTYNIFTLKDEQRKMFSIFILLLIINIVGELAITLTVLIPIVNIIVPLVFVLIGFFLNLIWYLFITNSNYPTEYYVKASIRYMSTHFFDYLCFVILIAIIPAILFAVISMFSSTLGSLFWVPCNAYISLAIAGFAANSIIPSEWYSGLAKF